jgi:Phage Terminase
MSPTDRKLATAVASSEGAFKRFYRVIGLDLEPWQDPVITVCDPNAAIVCAAASREQAGHLFEQARKFALRSDSIRKRITITRRELRSPTEGRLLVIAADAEKQLGWDPSMIFIDELGSHRDDNLYSNLRTALVKRPDARMRVISTAGLDPEGPLAALRERALEQGEIERDGPLTVARGENLAMVEWAAPADWPLERFHEANPASWVTAEAVAEMISSAVPEPRLRRLIGNQWVSREDAFITPDEWDSCAAPADRGGRPGGDRRRRFDPSRLHERRGGQARRRQRLSRPVAGLAAR